MEQYILDINNSLAATTLSAVATALVILIAALSGVKRWRTQQSVSKEVVFNIHDILTEIQNNDNVPSTLKQRALEADRAMMSE